MKRSVVLKIIPLLVVVATCVVFAFTPRESRWYGRLQIVQFVCILMLIALEGGPEGGWAAWRKHLLSPVMAWLATSLALFAAAMVAARHWDWPPGATFGAVPGAFVAGALLAWLPAATAAARRARERHRSRNGQCPGCGYDLTGNASGTCPECGKVMSRQPC